jgi:hypothetical protein
VGSSKSIVNINISILAEGSSECFNIGFLGLDLLSVDFSLTFFSKVESQVLKKSDL